MWLLALAVPFGWLPAVLYLALLSLLCWRDLHALPRVSELEARRELPLRFSADQEHGVQLVLANRSPRAVYAAVRDELPDCFELISAMPAGEIPAAGEARLAYSVKPTKRGGYRFGDVVLRLWRGSSLMQKQVVLKLADTVKVYPDFRTVNHYDLLAKIDQREAAVRRPRRTKAPGTDFESLRPYVSGEDLRNIDWKATARRGNLISRNKQVEKGQQLAVLLDAGRLMAQNVGSRSKLEHAMSAVVMLSFVAQKRGDAMAVACFSNKIDAFLPPVRGPALGRRVLEAIYTVQAQPFESDYWQVIAEVMAMLRRRSLVILFTDVLDTSGSAGLVNNLVRAAAKHLVLCVVLVEPRVREIADSIPATVEQTYKKAAAVDLLRRRHRALEHMRSRGIFILEADPEHLSVHLVRRYLEIREGDLQ